MLQPYRQPTLDIFQQLLQSPYLIIAMWLQVNSFENCHNSMISYYNSDFGAILLPWNVIIAAENLQPEGLILQRAIVVRLLSDFALKKATKDLGYFLAVTTLEKIGEGKVRQHTGDVLFPVVFNAISFKIFKGEILEGVVHKVLKHGVFMRCGPIENVYLSNLKMPDYRYVPGENACFMNDKMSKIGKDVTVRFVVIGTKWMEADRDFQALNKELYCLVFCNRSKFSIWSGVQTNMFKPKKIMIQEKNLPF
ncbi:DNA-directed RNA polymerase V subunit 7, partial [Mucuna pruriens]